MNTLFFSIPWRLRMLQRVVCVLAVFWLASGVLWPGVAPMNVGDSSADLLYTPLNPCRIIDTRLAGGKIASAETRGFQVSGTTGFSAQGGNASGCGVPENAAAVLINFVAVNPDGGGNLRGSAYPVPVPTIGSIINYQALTPILNIANAVAFPICDSSTQTCDVDISILVNGAATHLVADVLGFYRKFPDGGVTETQLADGAVTPAKIDSTGASTGQVLTYTGSDVQWQLPPQGTITAVNAGDGLQGGGTSGAVSLNVAFGGGGSANTVARSDHKHYVRTVIVSPVGTAADNGTALLAAVNGITTATADNPWLIKIEPGIYTLGPTSLVMKEFVDIEGSGQGLTRITGDGGFPGDGVMTGASNAELRSLTVESSGGNQPAAINTAGSNIRLRDLTLKASNGVSWAQPIWMPGGTVDLRNSNIVATNGGSQGNIGFYMAPPGGTANLEDVTITTSGTNFNYALWVNGTANVHRVTMNVSNTNAQSVTAVLATAGHTLNLSESVINASSTGGGSVVGIYLASGSIRNSSVNVTSTGTAQAFGLQVESSVDITGSSITATTTGTGLVFGIRNFGYGGVLQLVDSQISGKVGIFSTLFIAGASVVAEHSRIAGSQNTLTTSGAISVRIGDSRLEGGPVAGTTTCAGVYDETFTFFPSTCP